MNKRWIVGLVLLQHCGVAVASGQELVAHPSGADTRYVRVAWIAESGRQATPPCVNQIRVRRGVAASLARRVFTARTDGDVRLFMRPAPGKAVVLSLIDPAGAPLGSRHLRAESCAELTELVTFTLSVMLDFRVAELPQKRALASGELGVDSVSAQGEPVNQGGPVNSEQGSVPSVPEQAGPAPRTEPGAGEDAKRSLSVGAERTAEGEWLYLTLHGGAMGSVGLGATPLGGGYLGAELGYAGYWLQLWAGHSRSGAVERRGGELHASHSELELAACGSLVNAGTLLSTGACLGVAPQFVRITASGYSRNTGAATWSLLVTPSLQLTAPLGGAVSAVARVGLAVPVIRHDWTADRGTETVVLHEASAAGLKAWIGCKVALE